MVKNRTFKYVKPVLRNFISTEGDFGPRFLSLLTQVQKNKFGFIETSTVKDKDSIAIEIDTVQTKKELLQELIDFLNVNECLYGQVKYPKTRILNIKVKLEGFKEVKAKFLQSKYSEMYENVDIKLSSDDENDVFGVLTKSKEGLDNFYKKLIENQLITDEFDKKHLNDGRELDFPMVKEQEFFV